jgi:hypothetical protein
VFGSVVAESPPVSVTVLERVFDGDVTVVQDDAVVE